MRCGLTLVISERSPDGGVRDAVHEVLGSPYLSAVVDARSARSVVFPDGEPERAKLVRCEVFQGTFVSVPLGCGGDTRGMNLGYMFVPERT